MGQLMSTASSSTTAGHSAASSSSSGQAANQSPSAGPLLQEQDTSETSTPGGGDGASPDCIIVAEKKNVVDASSGKKTGRDSPLKAVKNKLKSLSLDPRSPSGIPRTPILVEDSPDSKAASSSAGATAGGDGTPKTSSAPKRGAAKSSLSSLPASKLSFEPEKENNENSKDEVQDPRPVMIETVEDEEERKENESVGHEETGGKLVTADDVDAGSNRSPLANVSNSEQTIVI